MKWMDIAWTLQGIAETAGDGTTPEIREMFRSVDRPDVTSDEIAWCAAFLGTCLVRGGISIDSIPKPDRLLARSYLSIGTPIDEPRVGAIAVIDVGSATASGCHVTFVSGVTETTIAGLGGNQANAVNVSHFQRAKVIGYRWPEAEVTAKDLAASGSRIALGAFAQVRDAVRGGLALITGGALVGTAPDVPYTPPRVVGHVQQLLFDAQTLQKFGIYCWRNAGWVLCAMALWWLGRMAVNAGYIAEARAQDHNTGAHTGRRSDDGAAA